MHAHWDTPKLGVLEHKCPIKEAIFLLHLEPALWGLIHLISEHVHKHFAEHFICKFYAPHPSRSASLADKSAAALISAEAAQTSPAASFHTPTPNTIHRHAHKQTNSSASRVGSPTLHVHWMKLLWHTLANFDRQIAKAKCPVRVTEWDPPIVT